jgi:hypothetical protein
MRSEYTRENLKGLRRNPYAHKLNTEVTVAVQNDAMEVFDDISRRHGVAPEVIMSRCLTEYAKKLQEA